MDRPPPGFTRARREAGAKLPLPCVLPSRLSSYRELPLRKSRRRAAASRLRRVHCGQHGRVAGGPFCALVQPGRRKTKSIETMCLIRAALGERLRVAHIMACRALWCTTSCCSDHDGHVKGHPDPHEDVRRDLCWLPASSNIWRTQAQHMAGQSAWSALLSGGAHQIGAAQGGAQKGPPRVVEDSGATFARFSCASNAFVLSRMYCPKLVS